MTVTSIEKPAQEDPAIWKILVVDDEPSIHQVTKLALRNLTVLGRPGQLISALSAKEARAQLEDHPDIAVVLLDVVMETENAGLDFIKHVREQAANALIRIILRTGQPGQAPERQIMLDYDINDYKEKTELTASKLYNSVVSSIRTFGHLQTMEAYRNAVDVLGSLNFQVFGAADAQALGQTLVSQLAALELFGGIDCRTEGGAGPIICLAGEPLSADLHHSLMEAALQSPGRAVAQDTQYAVAFEMPGGETMALRMVAHLPLGSDSRHVLELWQQSASIAIGRWAALT